MSSTTEPLKDAERTNLLTDDIETKEENNVHFLSKNDDERQSYILSNYSTLRTNFGLQWTEKAISNMIDKIASVCILPPNIDVNKTVSGRKKAVLKQEAEQLQNTKQDAVKSSCDYLIKYVSNKAASDPLLSINNPYKECENKEEEEGDDDDDDIEEEKEEKQIETHLASTLPQSKGSLLGSLDALISEEKEAAVELLETHDISDKILSDPCYRMLTEELKGNNQLNEIVSNDTDKVHNQTNRRSHNKKGRCSARQIKKSLKFTYMVGSRAFSLVDIVTDGLLLYTSSTNPDLWFLTLALVISMASPYIISYSSGVQLYLFRQTFDNVEGFKKILMFLFLLPTGILYFIFLDLADILLHIFRWVYFVVFCSTLQEIGQTEQILSEQLGMDRMNWEGFKRQRSIGQLMFESLPQFIFQTIIFYVMKYEIDVQGKSISDTQLMISIASAMINILSTTFKLQLEAKCCRSSFISYALICIKARVGWVPQREHILAAATDYESDIVAQIGYDMSHRPFIGCGIYKHSVEYDFSSTTIRYLMSALQMINNNNNKSTLHLDFQNTLRLLPLQDLIELYSLCSKKRIEVKSLKGGSSKYEYDWSSAIEISKNYGKDARLIKYARDDQGLPYIMKLMELSHYSDRRKIFRDLIEHDFDLNIHDLTTNESIVYTLIRSYDYKNLRYIFETYSKDKGVLIRLNYHNKDGISPLGVALKLYSHELHIRTQQMPATANTDPSQVDFLWQLLVKHGAELSFPCKKNYSDSSNQGDMSPLQYVLAELRHKALARHLMREGAQLYSKEIGSLNELFVNYQLEEETNWEPPEEKEEEDEDKEAPLSDDEAWEEDDDFIAHEEEHEQDDSWLALLCDVAKHCHRPIDFITDDNGNNPLHHFINDFNDKNKHKTRSHKFGTDDNRLRLKRLRHLMFICKGAWSKEKNNDGLYPYQLIIKKKDPALFFEFAELDSNFKQNIMEKKEFVQEMIDWIIAITERITKKYPHPETLKKNKKTKKYIDERVQKDDDVMTLDKLFKPKYLGKLIKWPNKYKKVMKAEEISLIGVALFDRKLVQVTKYLKDIWKFPVTKTGREKIKELEEMVAHRKAIGAEYRSKSRYNMLSKQNRTNETNNAKVDSTQFNFNFPHSKNRQEAGGKSLRTVMHNAPAPVLRQHTLMQMVNNKQITDVSSIDVDMMGHIDRIHAHRQAQRQVIGDQEIQEHQKSRIETIYSFFVEALSTADFVTDILVVQDLINANSTETPQVWSICFMLLFMISPYLVSHSIMCSLIDSRRESIKLDLLTTKKKGYCHCNLVLINILALILMTPLAIAWFTFVDVLFMVYLLISTFIFLSTCAKIDISDKMDDLLFKRLLGMSRMQIIGYRRLRTLSQLLFETLPQIALQAYILYYDREKGGNKLDTTEIYISIGVAAIHVVLELFIIYLDARASNMQLTHYAVICLGARLNWVPFAHQIRSRQKAHTKKASKAFYNFECVQFQPWFFEPFGEEFMYRIEYEFSPSSIKKLGEYFINLQILSSTDAPSNPYLAPVWLYFYKNTTLPVIYLGKTCCRSLDVYSFAEFFRSADKKVTLKSSQLDWTRIIFENTPNTSADNVYLKRLCQEFINYAEIKLITQLAPEVDFSTSDVLLYILDPAQQQSQFNILLILKKYYDENIHFGLSREIMHAVYKIIKNDNEENHVDWIVNNEADPSYSKVIFLLMWYTRRTLYRHQSPRGDLKFIDDPKRATFLSTYRDQTLPKIFWVRYDSNAISHAERYDDGVNKMRTIILNEAHSNPKKVSTVSPSTEMKREGSESIYNVKPEWNEERQQNGATYVNLADEEDGHEVPFPVEFEILECFNYFQPQIEKFLVDLTLRLKKKNEHLRIGDKALFKFFKKVFNKQTVDFLKLIINSPWFVLQNFPVHVRFAELFSRIDPVVRRLEMIHGYGHYLLASSKYRQSNRKQPMEFIVKDEYDNFEDDESHSSGSYHDEKEALLKNDANAMESSTYQHAKQILDIRTDPAYDKHKSLRAASTYDFITLPDKNETEQKMEMHIIGTEKSKKKCAFNKSDIMGISRIVIVFDTFVANDTFNHIYDEEKGESMGKIELFTVLPQRTKIVNDKLMLNKVVLKEVSFEEVIKTGKLIVDLFDNEILGMFRPIYMGRDRIDLMPLKINIQPTRPTIRVTCLWINAQITYLLRNFIDATAMKFESVLHKACSLQNVECVQFIREYQDIFDCSAVNDHYETALHLLCKMDDPNLEIFSLVLELADLGINQVRFDGLTAFQVLERNTNIDVEKKNEMLKEISSQPSYRAIRRKDVDKKRVVRNVLLIGAKNSGRHSLLKQLQIHYEKRAFSTWQKSVFRSQIIKYMICWMKLMIKHCGDDDIASLVNEDANDIYSMNADNLETMEHLDASSFESLRKLWDQEAIQRVFYQEGERLGLPDCVRYFFYRIDAIKQYNYVPNELDILRVPHNYEEETVLNSASYRLDDDIASDIQIRWICPAPSAHKILRSQCSETYNDIDTIIFMVSLTAFVESNKYAANDNHFIESLKLFQECANSEKFNKTKIVLLFNKTDILKKKIAQKDSILMQLINKKEIDTFDNDDYWDWIDLFQAMFRYQHRQRTVFSYPLSAAQPAKIRSILKELEDIIIQSDVPSIIDSKYYRDKALLDVKWIAKLDKNEDNEFKFNLKSVSAQEMKQIAESNDINIDYNAMLYKTAAATSKKKVVHFLISMEKAKHFGFVWAKWKRAKFENIPTYRQAKGFWQQLDCEKVNDLNGMLAILHHKELRTQFDGFTINHHPIRICFESSANIYHVSWWNMARMSKCNAITVDNEHYLHFQSPLNNDKIEWLWYNNDDGESTQYDPSCVNQLEAAYQANLESNFAPTVAVLQQNKHIFNHSILTNLQRFMEIHHKQKDPSYVLRFGKNQNNQNIQISHITQLRIYPDKNDFARDVQRRYDGRNSAWPV